MLEFMGGVDMIGWAVVAVVALYGFVNVFQSEGHVK